MDERFSLFAFPLADLFSSSYLSPGRRLNFRQLPQEAHAFESPRPSGYHADEEQPQFFGLFRSHIDDHLILVLRNEMVFDRLAHVSAKRLSLSLTHRFAP